MRVPSANPDRFPHGHAVLAIELQPQTLADRLVVEQRAATELAEAVAADLARLVPEIAGRGLAVLGAHFDPTELLRPGWPVHATLRDLLIRAPDGQGGSTVVAFGSHQGRLPASLSPDANQVGGPLRLLPITVVAPKSALSEIASRMEEVLMETGMAGAGTALLAQEVFGARVEHARYLSLHDLLALTAMQYQHAGLTALWPLLEAALLAPEAEEWLDAPPEPVLLHADGKVFVGAPEFDAWCASELCPADCPTGHREAMYAHFRRRQRQLSAVLEAHGVPVRMVDCPVGTDARSRLLAERGM